MSDFLISTIVPCYNAELFIDACLDSLVNQTIGIENMQVILVNDGSTDGTLEHLKRYQQKYPRNIEIITLEQNKGQANARNIGIGRAEGEYLAFLDADDWLEWDTYKKLVGAAQKYDCDLVQCSTIAHFNDEQVYQNLNIPERKYTFFDEEERKDFLINYGIAPVSGASIYDASWLKQEKIFFPDFRKYEDNYFAGIIKYAVRSYYPICDYCYHYRVLECSNSHSHNDSGHFLRLNVELELLKTYRIKGWYELYYEQIRNDFLKMFYENTLHIIFCQFDYIPLDIIRMMQSAVKEIYPDYLEYYFYQNDTFNFILTVPFSFPLDVWEKLKEVYLKWINYRKKEELLYFFEKMRNSLNIRS